MRPTAARSDRSSIHHPRSSPIPSPSTTSSIYHQQQLQQQQILYAPVSSPMVTLQPCAAALHPSCVYPSVQSHVVPPNSAHLLQDKNNRWHAKNKPPRGQHYYQQQQQQLSYSPKPVVLFDQPSTSIASIPPSTTSFLVASSTFTHAGPLHSEHYNNNSGVTHLLPQPFNFKPPDMQTFCLIQDRQNTQQQQQHPMQASYYNISATNTCSLQTVNANSSFPIGSLNPYTSLTSFTNNQFPATAQSSPLFSNPPVGLVLAPLRGDKPSSTLDFTPLKYNADKISSESRVVPIGHSEKSNSWPSQIETFSKNNAQTVAGNNKSFESADCALRKSLSAVAKTDEEHYSDESSNSFDFTIEAEKMVSALCNTTSSHDLGKEESKPGNKTDSTTLFSGAGDNVSNKASWFGDFCCEYENGTSIGVQTDGPCIDRSQYPELIRKTAYWGCAEAEIVLGSDGLQTDSKRSWLACLSSATRTAITKSSTCIPVFAGDRVFADDLINALLRISNGWLSLDNYLNKQHFPNLLDRLEPELIARFHTWEESTCELLKQIVRTFQTFGENKEMINQKRNTTCCGSSSFPGDLSLYASYDLFAPPLSSNSLFQPNTIEKSSSQEKPHSATSASLSTSSLRNFQYNSNCQQEQQSVNPKESKLRSKWTITENLSSVINATKSVPNVSVCHIDVSGLAGHKLRTKDTSSSRKFDSTQKSLNAEFCQLRNKVMESSTDATKDRRHDYTPEDKLTTSLNNTEPIRLQYPVVNAPISYSGLYARNCLSVTFPLTGHSSYPTPNPGIPTYGGLSYPSSAPCPSTDINSRSSRNSEQTYGAKGANVNPVYVGRSQTEQLELPAVPRNKVTLLSQIEPRTFDKESEEMATNLSAWFASMRNAQPPVTVPAFEEQRTNENSAPRLFVQEMPKYSVVIAKQPQIDANRQFQALQNLPNIQSTPWAASSFVGNRFHVQQAPEEYDSSEDVRVYMKPGSYNVPKKRHQRRSNRRSENNATSRNVHASSHNNACSNKGKGVTIPASSTPLSHTNVPTLSTNIVNTTLIKTSFPPASQLPAPLFNLENSPRILKRTESLQDARQDVTWKAACASAEILLEALNIKDYGNTSKNVEFNDSSSEKEDKNEENAEVLAMTSRQSDPKSVKHDNVDCASSYEASEDDSGSTCRLSPSTSVVSVSQSREDENALSIKTNVKTDSWLIRTLNNASIVGKQKLHKDDVDRQSLESWNSSEIVDEKPDQLASSLTADADIKTRASIINTEYPAIFSREHVLSSSSKNGETSTKGSEGHAGRATYSETVRRSMKTSNLHLEKREPLKSCATNSSVAIVIPIPGRKCQRKDPEQSYQLLHKSRRSADRKTMRNADSDDLQLEEGPCAKVGAVKSNNVTSSLTAITKMNHGKKKDLEGKCASKSGDRGWSVWCSSRRKQNHLSPLALSKLETIHRTVWQMDEAKIFKYPYSCDNKDGQSALIMEDYCKVVKSPMFLEIIEYKLKNRIYHKVEHAVKDFRRIIYNARLYHQHDDERIRKIEVLSKKLEDLLEEHFSNWDFDNVTSSSREDSLMQLRLKTSEQKSIAGRCDSTKKGVSSSIIAESSSLH